MYKYLLILLIMLFSASLAQGQELAGYEVADHLQLGLNVAPFEKWGMAVADIDRNGWPDIFTIRWASPGYSRLYLNTEGVFAEITNQTPLQMIEANEGHTTTVSLVDYDNDGDRDIFLGADKKMYLLRNDDNIFTDVAESVGIKAGIPGFVSEYQFLMGAWADYDLDGDLDFVVGQQNNPDLIFYKNEGGTFINVASQLGFVGIAGHQGPIDIPQGSRRTRHIAWIDFDMDGDPDLNVGDLIYRNDGGTFTNITPATGFNPSQIEAADWFDYDNDGDLDYFKIVVTGYTNELWENRNGTLVDVSLEAGVSYGDEYRGVTIGDYDNDGDQDVFVQNNNNQALDMLFLNEADEQGHSFSDVARWIGLDLIGDRKGAAFFDYDMDGFLDIYIASAQYNHILYHNLTLPGNNWIGFMLEGTQSNRDAIGTWVKLYAGDKVQVRYTRTPSSWQCQDNPYVHFGIGTASSVDSVVIRWPLGLVEVLKNVAINKYHEITEGQSTPVKKMGDDKSAPAAYTLEQNYPNPFNASTNIDYHMSQPGDVRIAIVNMRGEEVWYCEMSHSASGMYTLSWDGKEKSGIHAPSGVYIIRMVAEGFCTQKKLVLMK